MAVVMDDQLRPKGCSAEIVDAAGAKRVVPHHQYLLHPRKPAQEGKVSGAGVPLGGREKREDVMC